MRRSIVFITAIMAAVVAFPGAARAQYQDLTIDGTIGFGRPSGTDGSEWNTGFSFGTNWFSWPSEGLGIGFRLAYDRWMPPLGEMTGQAGDWLNPEAKGSTSIFSIVPSARLMTDLSEYGVAFFCQGGAGLFILRANSDVTGLVGGEQSKIQFDEGKWIGRWGFQVGPGISFAVDYNVTMDIVPLYTAIFNGDHTFHYFMTTIGLSFVF